MDVSEKPVHVSVMGDAPSSRLLDLVNDLDWNAVTVRARSCPQDALWQDYDDGETPLYAACQNSPPADVVEALLAANRDAAKLAPTKNGDLPIHLACRYRAEVRVLRALLDAYPLSALRRTKWGKTPFHALYDGFDSNQSDSDRWEKVELLLKFAASEHYSVRDQPREWLALHAVVDLGKRSAYPRQVFDLVARLCPQQARKRDSRGNLPLHIAASTPVCAGKRGKNDGNNLHVFDRLLELHRVAAKLPDWHGRLPLHIALSNGHSWVGGVGSIFLAAPMAIRVSDPNMGMLPFMIACLPVAVASEDTVLVDTIYCLIRAQPDVLVAQFLR